MHSVLVDVKEPVLLAVKVNDKAVCWCLLAGKVSLNVMTIMTVGLFSPSLACIVTPRRGQNALAYLLSGWASRQTTPDGLDVLFIVGSHALLFQIK
jgi:hypothetical protein